MLKKAGAVALAGSMLVTPAYTSGNGAKDNVDATATYDYASKSETIRKQASPSIGDEVGFDKIMSKIQSGEIYVTQFGMAFTENRSELSFLIPAISQAGKDVYGVSYLGNGLTDKKYWIQAAVSQNIYKIDPISKSKQIIGGFSTVVEVFDPDRKMVASTVINLPEDIEEGDKIYVNMHFDKANDRIVVGFNNSRVDKILHATSIPAFGATCFVGTGNNGQNGIITPTGIMTELFSVYPFAYAYKPKKVTYVFTADQQESDKVFMWYSFQHYKENNNSLDTMIYNKKEMKELKGGKAQVTYYSTPMVYQSNGVFITGSDDNR